MSKFKFVTYNTSVGSNDAKLERRILHEGGQDDFIHVHVPSKDEEAFYKEAADADGICAWTPMTLEQYKKLDNCKIIVAPAIGADRFDLAGATECGIAIANVPDYCGEDVAFHTVAMMLDCVKKITMLDRTVREGKWNDKLCGKVYRMVDKVYGLASFGRIPQRVTEMMRPFGVKFIAYDPFVPDSVFEENNVDRAETLEELFEKSDFISVHTPYMKATHHMIGEKQINCMKDGGIIVITGRGGVVDETAVKDALDSGKLAAVATDVIEDEINNHSVLMNHPKVIMTPHCGYYSEDASNDLKMQVVEQIIETVREGKPPANLLNKDVLGKARFEKS